MDKSRKRQLLKEMAINKFNRQEIEPLEYLAINKYIDKISDDKIDNILESRLEKVIALTKGKVPGTHKVFDKISLGKRLKILKQKRSALIRRQSLIKDAIKRLGTQHPAVQAQQLQSQTTRAGLKDMVKDTHDEMAEAIKMEKLRQIDRKNDELLKHNFDLIKKLRHLWDIQ